MKDYYELLEVRNDASNEVIKMAYKALALKYHPDVSQGDKATAENKMKAINEAFEVISDPEKRAEYDRIYTDRNERNKRVNEEKEERAEAYEDYNPENIERSLSKNQQRIHNFKNGKLGWFSLYAIIPLLFLLWPLGIYLISKRIVLTKEIPHLRKPAIITLISYCVFILFGFLFL